MAKTSSSTPPKTKPEAALEPVNDKPASKIVLAVGVVAIALGAFALLHRDAPVEETIAPATTGPSLANPDSPRRPLDNDFENAMNKDAKRASQAASNTPN